MKILLASSLLLLASCSDPDPSPLASVALVDTEVRQSVGPSVFLFGRSPFPQPPKAETNHINGTAFMVDGQLITALHVVDPKDGGKVVKITITNMRGERAEVKVLRIDIRVDMAALEIVSGTINLPSLQLSREAPDRGDTITQIGNPAMILFVISKGLIVGFNPEEGYNIAAIDTAGGNSGGPDLNTEGRVIGMCHTLITGTRFTGIGTWQAIRDFLYPSRIR